jgi:hemoglobin
MRLHGHPRLRMRHAHVPVSQAMRDAWMRAMRKALSDAGVSAESRAFLDEKLAALADFLRNQ